MANDNWERVQEIFLAAADLPETEQTIFLKDACRDDDTLRREVEGLLRADSRAGNALAAVIESEAGQLLDDGIIGTRLGSYLVVREIGSGGMGTVYLARRDDDQYQKQVAIKVVKRGMDTASLLGRFRHERQILADLDHPYIARLLDGGSTPDGRPFFVMEQVEGRTIGSYCRELKLTVDARLHLFLRVCEAVSYAHRHRVVHRDLKPGNILVTEDGTPKLLDFGVAKLLTPDGDSGLTLTAFPGRPLTPEYASPEQVRGLPATSATDVYALGAILYELLTEKRAQQFSTHTPMEIERVVCETEVPPPSTVAGNASMARKLAGDLDNIVLMAMRKESARRYQSVDKLAEDIRRHFQGLPIAARQDSMVYRTGKFVRRNRLVISAASAVVLCVLVLGAMLWRSRQADPQPSDALLQSTILRRFTSDAAITMEPDISGDGNLVAYVSDRGGGPSHDLWVQPVSGGEARRLTDTPGDERYPRFSPDGRQIAYYRERDAAPGIYIIPATGGEARKLVDHAAYPRWSPDGRYIACLLNLSARSTLAHSMAIVPASGGPPRVIATGIPTVSPPIWSPDGKRLLFRGSPRAESQDAGSSHWYVIPAAGGKPEPVEVETAMRKAGIRLGRGNLPTPDFWYRQNIIFSGAIGDSRSLWDVTLSPDALRAVGVARRLTVGTETEDHDLSVSHSGLMAFGCYSSEISVYVLSLASRELERVTQQPGSYFGLGTTDDHRKLVYSASYGSRRRVLVRDLSAGVETEMTYMSAEPFRSAPVLSPDGSQMAYERVQRPGGQDHLEKAHIETVIRPLEGGPPQSICENCGEPRAWFPGGRYLVTHPSATSVLPDASQLASRLVDLATRQVTGLDVRAGYAASISNFSPDGRWAAVTLVKVPASADSPDEIFFAPVRPAGLAPFAEWISIPAHASLRWAGWSDDSRTLYFFSDAAEEESIQSITLDTSGRKLGGPVQTLYRFNKPSFVVRQGNGLVAAGDRLFFSALDGKGNIWITQLPK